MDPNTELTEDQVQTLGGALRSPVVDKEDEQLH